MFITSNACQEQLQVACYSRRAYMYEKEHGVPHTREKGNSIRYSQRRLNSTKSSENFFFMKKNSLLYKVLRFNVGQKQN